MPHSYLYEEITGVSHDGITLCLEFATSGSPNGIQLVFIHCASIAVRENHDARWQEIFGTRHMDLYEKFTIQNKAGRWFGDREESAKFLAEIDAPHA